MKINTINTASYLQNGKVNNNVKSQSPSFEGVAMHKAGKTMKALALAGMMGMAAVAMSSCKQPTGGDEGYEIPAETPTKTQTGEETQPTTPVTPTTEKETPVVTQSPVQKELISMFETLGVLPTESVSMSAYTQAKGDVEFMSYTDQSHYNFEYTIDKEKSTDDTLIYNVEGKNLKTGSVGKGIATLKKTEDGLSLRNDWEDCTEFFVNKGSYIQSYLIYDGRTGKYMYDKYEKDGSDPTKIHVFAEHGLACNNFEYTDINIKLAN